MNQSNWNTDPDFESTIDELAKELVDAKARESGARSMRQDIENKIIERIGVKDEGTTTAKGDRFTLSTAGKVTRTVEAEAVDALRDRIPAPLFNRLFSFKPSLNLKEFRYIQNNEPDYFNLVAPAIASKPAKPAVSVKEIK